MKNILLFMLLAVEMLQPEAMAQKASDFNVVAIKSLPVKANTPFVFRPKVYNTNKYFTYNLVLTTHQVIEDDSTSFVVLSISTDIHKKELGIPPPQFACPIDSEGVVNHQKECKLNDPNATFFNGYFQGKLKEAVYKTLSIKNKRIYFVVLNAYNFDLVHYPISSNSVKEALLKWKIISSQCKKDSSIEFYIYCMGVCKKGQVTLDIAGCLGFPHE